MQVLLSLRLPNVLIRKIDQCTINQHASANRGPRTGVDASFHILNILESMEYIKPWSYLDRTDVTCKINKIHSFTSYPDSAQYTLTGEARWIEKSVYSQEKRNIWWVRKFHRNLPFWPMPAKNSICLEKCAKESEEEL